MSTETAVVVPPPDRAVVWLAFPLLGAGAGWLLAWAADWVAALPVAPFHAVFRLVAGLPEPHATIGFLSLGALAGLVVAHLALDDLLTVTVTDDQVTLIRGASAQAIDRRAVRAVFLDGKTLVFLGPAEEELARAPSDLRRTHLQNAFLQHGYPWLTAAAARS